MGKLFCNILLLCYHGYSQRSRILDVPDYGPSKDTESIPTKIPPSNPTFRLYVSPKLNINFVGLLALVMLALSTLNIFVCHPCLTDCKIVRMIT